jgi:putative transposase
MPGRARKLIITERQQAILQVMIRSSTCPQAVAQRARMILLAFDGLSNQDIAEHVGCERHAVGPWRHRWADAFERLVLIECCEKTSALPRAIEGLLGDLPRSGSPGKFTAEQVTQILAVACEDPGKSDRPVTHWTPPELAYEVIKRGIVETISPRQVGRFLKIRGAPAAPQPVLAQCPARGSRGVRPTGRSRLRLLPGRPATVGSRQDSHRQRG